MNRYFDDDKDDFPPRPQMPIWKFATLAVLVVLIIGLVMNSCAGPAQAGQTRNEAWHPIPTDKCFSQFWVFPFVRTTFDKIGSSGPIRKEVIRESGQPAIISFTRNGAGFAFQFRRRPRTIACLDAWRTIRVEQ